MLGEVAAEVVERARAVAPNDVRITLDIADVALVEADSELIALVLANLIRNAWLHNPSEGRNVIVRVDRARRASRVAVSDDGLGVPAADRARIFDAFVRGRTSASRGSGIGLALCRQIVAAHGGTCELASTGASGSTFVLEVPSSR